MTEHALVAYRSNFGPAAESAQAIDTTLRVTRLEGDVRCATGQRPPES